MCYAFFLFCLNSIFPVDWQLHSSHYHLITEFLAGYYRSLINHLMEGRRGKINKIVIRQTGDRNTCRTVMPPSPPLSASTHTPQINTFDDNIFMFSNVGKIRAKLMKPENSKIKVVRACRQNDVVDIFEYVP